MYKISAIIPIFNIEKYLPRCIESIIGQTIFNSIEVLLVNDGSTDSSAEICNKYSSIYPNIKVINKENGGVSSARNCGIDSGSGKYIAFVDGDDYVDNDYFEIMFSSIEKEKVDLVVFDYYLIFEDGNKRSYRNTDTPQKWNSDLAMEEFLKGGLIGINLFDKLYVTDYVKKIRFNPEVKIGEDLYFIFQYLQMINSVHGVFKPGYYYVQRCGSAMNAEFSEKYFDAIKVANWILEWAKNNKNYYEFAKAHYIHSACKTVERAYKCGDFFKFKDKIDALLSEIREYSIFEAKKNLSTKQFLGFMLMCYSPSLYLFVCKVKRI